jgi:hypothetical protein
MTESIRTNEYSGSVRRLAEEKLREYIDNPGNYHDEAILAAIWELSRRRSLLKDEMKLEAIISERSKPKDVALTEIYKPDFRTDESNLPILYSIRSIQIFSVLFSVIAGGILMAINFSRTTQKTEAVKVFGFSLAFTLFYVMIIVLLGTQSPLLSIAFNLLGAYLINELFWKRVFGLNFRFKNQQVWSALVMAFLILTPLIWYLYKTGALQTL